HPLRILNPVATPNCWHIDCVWRLRQVTRVRIGGGQVVNNRALSGILAIFLPPKYSATILKPDESGAPRSGQSKSTPGATDFPGSRLNHKIQRDLHPDRSNLECRWMLDTNLILRCDCGSHPVSSRPTTY